MGLRKALNKCTIVPTLRDRIKIEFLDRVVVQGKFRGMTKTITTPRFSVFRQFLELKKMSEPGEVMPQKNNKA